MQKLPTRHRKAAIQQSWPSIFDFLPFGSDKTKAAAPSDKWYPALSKLQTHPSGAFGPAPKKIYVNLCRRLPEKLFSAGMCNCPDPEKAFFLPFANSILYFK
jgi:hypothetical protein